MIIKVKTILFQEKVVGKTITFFSILIFINLQLFPGVATAQTNSLQDSILNTKISLHLESTSIQKILDTLSTYPNIKFSYINYQLPLQDKVTISTTEQSLKHLLDSIFEPYGIQYYVVSKQIVLKKEKKKNELTSKLVSKPEYRRISISFFGALGSSYRRLKSSNPVLVNDRNRDEKSISNFNGAVYATYQYLPSIIFRSGISLFNTGEKGNFSIVNIHIDSIVPGNNGNGNGSGNGNGNGNNVDTISTNTQQDFTYKNKYNYLSIPFMIGYRFEKKQISLSAFAGASLGLMLSYTTTFPLDNQSYQTITTNPDILSIYQRDPRTHAYRKVVFTIPLMVEAEYSLTQDFGLSAAVGLNYFTSSIYNSRELAKQRPYYINLGVGLSYHLRKASSGK